jgi:hypothetical protein
MSPEATLKAWEFASYIVTVLGLPLALFALWREMRAERRNEAKEIEQREDEIYVELSQQYTAFLEAVLSNPDLDLLSESDSVATLTPAQAQKKRIYYEMLIALFERAYILLYEPGLTGDAARRWQSWADYVEWWLKKPDFRAYALDNLDGEDAAFATFVRAQAASPP